MKETLQDILQLINKVQNSEYGIKDAAKILIKMKNVDEIAKIIKEECKQKEGTHEKKFNMFLLMNEIILESKIFTTDFVKAFGYNLKEMTGLCCENNSNPQNLEELCGIINHWEKQKIYASTFMDKLRKIIAEKANIFGISLNLKPEYNGAKAAVQDQKHNKALIRDYKLIQENVITKQMYEIKMLEEIFQKKHEELTRMGPLEEIALALKSDNPTEVERAQEKLTILKKLNLETKELLVKIVEEYNDSLKKCSKKIDGEMKDWAAFNNDTYELYKQNFDSLKEQSK